MSDKGNEKAETGGHKRRALGVLEKHTIRKKRRETEASEASELTFLTRRESPLKSSTVSDVLKDSAQVVVSSGGSWKRKARKEEFPILCRTATTMLIEKLIHVPTNKEDYTGFALSSGWLFNLKMRNGLSNKKTKGGGGKVDEALLPGMRDELKEELEDYALRDVFSCDELALQ